MQENSHHEHTLSVSKLEERIVFFFVCVGVIAVTYGILVLVDFLPEAPTVATTAQGVGTQVETDTQATAPETADAEDEVSVATEGETLQTTVSAPTASVAEDALPLTVIFDSLKREVKVLNPKLSTVSALDTALLSGVVRHPNSADFDTVGTIFLLGHSSYLPTVRNKNFQAFNGIQKLVWGDTIRLRSADTEYVYSVDRVYEAKAADAEVAIQYGIPKLVLATCNSFGSKDDRFVVEATLVSSHPIKG